MPGWKYEPVFEPVQDEPRSQLVTFISVAVKSSLVALLGGYLCFTLFVYVKTGRLDLVVRPDQVSNVLKAYR